MVEQILVFEGDWNVCESTPPTPDHTPANGVEPSLKVQISDLKKFLDAIGMGFQAGFRNNRKK